MRRYTPIVLSLLLVSCSSSPKITDVGPGVVKSEQQLLSKEEVKKAETKKDVLVGTGTGAAVGGATGAATGAVVGAASGVLILGIVGASLCTVFTLGIGAVPCFAGMGGLIAAGAGSMALMGAGAGALIGAGGGALVGADGSYVYASNKDPDKIKGKYKYEVLEDGQSTPISFEQFPDIDYAVGDKVEVYESEYRGNKTYFIKSVEKYDSNTEKTKDTKDKK